MADKDVAHFAGMKQTIDCGSRRGPAWLLMKRAIRFGAPTSSREKRRRRRCCYCSMSNASFFPPTHNADAITIASNISDKRKLGNKISLWFCFGPSCRPALALNASYPTMVATFHRSTKTKMTTQNVTQIQSKPSPLELASELVSWPAS